MKWTTSVAVAAAPLTLAAGVKKADPRGVTIVNGMSGAGITSNSLTEIIIIWANPGNGAPTTTINPQTPPTEAAGDKKGDPTAAAPAASHTVKVGGPAGLVYTPDQLNNIPIGDTIVFEFLAKNHTVTQSAFAKPCDALDGGMDSGFMANPDNSVVPPPQVAMQVMVDTPLWFYCQQQGHCGKGMVFSVNPTAEKTHAQFQAMAIAQKGDGKATPITGGAPGDAPPAAPPAAPSAPPADAPPADAPPANGVTPGTGKIGADGSCTCVVQCAPGSFPVEAQGIGSHGGFGGSLPTDMVPIGGDAPPAAPPADAPKPDAPKADAQPSKVPAPGSNGEPLGGSEG